MLRKYCAQCKKHRGGQNNFCGECGQVLDELDDETSTEPGQTCPVCGSSEATFILICLTQKFPTRPIKDVSYPTNNGLTLTACSECTTIRLTPD